MVRLDFIIFGATGFTGKHAVEEMVRLGEQYPEITWGTAGRSKEKLDGILIEVSGKTGKALEHIRTIAADIGNEQSLIDMCRQARVLINCCGPYRLYGEPVVKAAVENKCSYVDVNGEPQFMESMQIKYDKLAKEAGVYVVNACGFDSIPNDMGVVFLQQNFDGVLNSVESYLFGSVAPEYAKDVSERGILNHGTWESIVLGIANRSELSSIRRTLFPEELPNFKPKLKKRTIHKKHDMYALPFPGADASVVERTQRYFYDNDQKRPVQFQAYMQFSSLCTTMGVIFYSILLFIMSSMSCTINLLLKYPKKFTMGAVTHEGPTENVMKNTKFQLTMYGEGWTFGTNINTTSPNKNMIVKVNGVNPGYGAAVTALLFSAIAILKEEDKMPSTGGVMTTGAAFSRTSLIKNLNKNNLTFEIVNEASVKNVATTV